MRTTIALFLCGVMYTLGALMVHDFNDPGLIIGWCVGSVSMAIMVVARGKIKIQ